MLSTLLYYNNYYQPSLPACLAQIYSLIEFTTNEKLAINLMTNSFDSPACFTVPLSLPSQPCVSSSLFVCPVFPESFPAASLMFAYSFITAFCTCSADSMCLCKVSCYVRLQLFLSSFSLPRSSCSFTAVSLCLTQLTYAFLMLPCVFPVLSFSFPMCSCSLPAASKCFLSIA